MSVCKHGFRSSFISYFRVTEDGFDNLKLLILYDVPTRTHFYNVPFKMVSKYYQIIFNILRLSFFHDIISYQMDATAPILPFFAR